MAVRGALGCKKRNRDARIWGCDWTVLVIDDWKQIPAEVQGGAVSIGNFDGVHQGHARLVGRLRDAAARVDGPAVVFTFDPHPVRVLRPGAAPPPLTWLERKAELLGELGVDAVLAYRTDEELLALEPDAFFDCVICKQLAAKAMVEGPNFRFGRNRQGDADRLGRLCRDRGMLLEIVEPLQIDGAYVSSSRIRTLIAEGDVGQASELLTRPYRIRGLVVHGDRRGREIGFPTANLDGVDTLLPGQGVYACFAVFGERRHPAAANIGPNPTFGQHASKIEIHLLDYSGTLYGSALEVDFLARLRDIRPFESREALCDQLQRDVDEVRRISSEFGKRGTS